MKKLVIEGKHEISGEIEIGGSKNSVVSILPAAMLTSGKVVIKNVPDILDVHNLIEIMEYLGSNITFENEVITIDNKNVVNRRIPNKMSSKLRASYYFMGSLLGRFKHAEIPSPGGCVIGARPIDFHLAAFKRFGAKEELVDETYILDAKSLTGCDNFLDFPSVGATANIMITAVLAEGKTTIVNAAREPEIKNLADFLISMGAKIEGAGTSTIKITGVKKLHDGEVSVIPDRIEGGTYLIIGALIGRNLTVKGIDLEDSFPLLYKLKEAGVNYRIDKDKITLSKTKKLKPVNIRTTVHPGFPTDLGQPMSTFLTQCNGESTFEETIYENRLRHVPHLNSMGARIKAFDKKAIITGKTDLRGRKVTATDLRAGASMLVAGLVAEGTTTIANIEHLLRGYERLVEKLNNVGANIKLIDE